MKQYWWKGLSYNCWHKSWFGLTFCFFWLQTNPKRVLEPPKVPRHTLRQTSVSEHYPSVMYLVLFKLSTLRLALLETPLKDLKRGFTAVPLLTFWFHRGNTVGTKRCASSRTSHGWLYTRARALDRSLRLNISPRVTQKPNIHCHKEEGRNWKQRYASK